MKRKNREINIFSMSALDLFASAMGAFILIALIALPFYLKTDKSLMADLQKVQQQLDTSQAQLQQCQVDKARLQQQNNQLQQQLSSCQQKLKKTFIAVVMQWGEAKVDIDLHVTNPEGHEFYYSKHNRDRSHYPSSIAKLSRDTTRGPGIEVWEILAAKPGRYKVEYLFYARHGGANSAMIEGSVYTSKGSRFLPAIRVNAKEKKLAVVVIVDNDGSVRFE